MKTILFLLLLFISLPVSAETVTIPTADIISVYDGDTFFVDIKNWPPVIGKRIGIRVSGIDTPEIRGKCPQEKKLALVAKAFTANFLKAGRTVELRNIKRGKYFRIVADVYVNDANLTDALIDARLGYSYYGETKYSFCLNK